jgi:hypothetical protein
MELTLTGAGRQVRVQATLLWNPPSVNNSRLNPLPTGKSAASQNPSSVLNQNRLWSLERNENCQLCQREVGEAKR